MYIHDTKQCSGSSADETLPPFPPPLSRFRLVGLDPASSVYNQGGGLTGIRGWSRQTERLRGGATVSAIPLPDSLTASAHAEMISSFGPRRLLLALRGGIPSSFWDEVMICAPPPPTPPSPPNYSLCCSALSSAAQRETETIHAGVTLLKGIFFFCRPLASRDFDDAQEREPASAASGRTGGGDAAAAGRFSSVGNRHEYVSRETRCCHSSFTFLGLPVCGTFCKYIYILYGLHKHIRMYVTVMIKERRLPLAKVSFSLPSEKTGMRSGSRLEWRPSNLLARTSQGRLPHWFGHALGCLG
ncbi:hypothetical protein L209DRAFT_755433 [Thermothelomyces heterothallicus CBS 203.75]